MPVCPGLERGPSSMWSAGRKIWVRFGTIRFTWPFSFWQRWAKYWVGRSISRRVSDSLWCISNTLRIERAACSIMDGHFLGKNHLGEALWGRGNSWYTAGLVDYLELLKENEGVRAVLLDTLQVQVSALADCQDASGLWHTLLDDKDSYLETSASCAFAYGILKAVRMGYLEEKFEAVGKRGGTGRAGSDRAGWNRGRCLLWNAGVCR